MSSMRPWLLRVPAMAVAAVLCLSSASASGAMLTFDAIADSDVTSAAASQNYGTLKELRVKTSYWSYVKFDVTLDGSKVTGAQLRLDVTDASPDSGTVYRTASNWRESAGSPGTDPVLTWARRPVLGTQIGSAVAAPVGTITIPLAPATFASDGTYSIALANSSTADRAIYTSREGGAAPRLILTTEPPPAVIAAAGDIACSPGSPSWSFGCHQQQTSDLLNAMQLDAVLTLGDNQYYSGTLGQFQQSFANSWGKLGDLLYPSPGNHEYNTPGGQGYFDYFASLLRPTGDRDKGYYSFDVGSWHVISLNSECANVGGCAAGKPQERWLRADLAAHARTACTLAYWHHPRFTSSAKAGTENSAALWQALYENGADVILNGHAHNYERFAGQRPDGTADPVRGIRQFVVGTGGAGFDSFSMPPEPNSEVRDNTTFGVLKLVLRSSGYEWNFVPEPGSTFTDAGTADCH